MMTPQEISRALTTMNILRVHRDTGLHFNTLYRIRNGKIANPSFDTVKRLSDYLKGQRHE